MAKELCRTTIDTNNYYASLDANDVEEYWNDDLEMEKYYATKYPANKEDNALTMPLSRT